MKKWCILTWAVFQACHIKAQITRTPVTAAYTRITSYSKQNVDAFSFTGNQAAIATVKQITAGVYGERRFLLQELTNYSAAFVLPTSSGNFGLKGDYFGSSSYNETQLGLAYGRSLGQKLNVGVQFNYNSISAGMYGKTSAINFDAGAIFHLTEQLHAGVHVYNPAGTKMGNNEEEELPSVYNFGLGYDVSEPFFIGAEVEKMEDQPVSVNAGIQYKIERVLGRAGIVSATSVYYLGFGVLIRNFRVDVTASIHPQLGVSPGLLLIYSPAN